MLVTNGRAPRWSWLLRLALAAVLVVVTLSRAVSLAGSETPLEAPDERRWFAWAYREPDAVARLESLRALLAPGESVELSVPPHYKHGEWLLVMARYSLSRQRVLGLQIRDREPRALDGADAQIVRRTNGSFFVEQRKTGSHSGRNRRD